MSDASWRRLTHVLQNTLHGASEAERADFVAAVSAIEPSLRSDLESIVESARTDPDLFEHSAARRVLDTILPKTGEMLGHYKIIEQIGAGAAGVVYRASDARLKRDVAIKVLVETFGASSNRLALFTQEAQAVAALSHPNILTLYDVGTERGIWYAVTELLRGQTLRRRLADGPLPVDEAVEHAIAIARGLSAAHAKNIVHRDLKPENLMVSEDGWLKILDFGVAQVGRATTAALDDETTRAQGSDGMWGTLGYMSPEQLRGQPVDHRSDLFALGTILYEMLAGRHPFLRASWVDTVSAILRDAPPPLPTVNPAVSSGLDRIVRRSLRKSPSERFQSAGEIAARIQNRQLSRSEAVAPVQAGQTR